MTKNGRSVVGRAAVEQVRDVRMIEAGEDLLFVPEAAQASASRVQCRAGHDLDRDVLVVLAVGASRQVDGAHAAASDLAHHFVGAEPAADEARLRGRDWRWRAGWMFEEGLRVAVRLQQAHHVRAQRVIAGACLR